MGRIVKLLVLFLMISVPSFADKDPVIEYEGSSTAGFFMKDAAKVYKKAIIERNTQTESNGGEICPLAKTCDIGGVARDIDPLLISRGLYYIPLAYDFLTAIVNHKNPVKELTSDQLKDIFSGKILNWKEIGGEDRPITVYIAGKESATRDVFKKQILKKSDYGVNSKVTRPDWRILANVNIDKGGIGQISYSFVANKDQVERIMIDRVLWTIRVRELIIDGQNPREYQSEYSIRRILHLTTNGPPQGAVKEFIDWVLSDEGREVIKIRFAPFKKESD